MNCLFLECQGRATAHELWCKCRLSMADCPILVLPPPPQLDKTACMDGWTFWEQKPTLRTSIWMIRSWIKENSSLKILGGQAAGSPLLPPSYGPVYTIYWGILFFAIKILPWPAPNPALAQAAPCSMIHNLWCSHHILPALMGHLETAVLCTGPQFICTNSPKAHFSFQTTSLGFTVMDCMIHHSKSWIGLDNQRGTWMCG